MLRRRGLCTFFIMSINRIDHHRPPSLVVDLLIVLKIVWDLTGALSKSAPLTRRKRGPLLLTPQAGGWGRLPIWTACIRRSSLRLSTASCTLGHNYRKLLVTLWRELRSWPMT